MTGQEAATLTAHSIPISESLVPFSPKWMVIRRRLCPGVRGVGGKPIKFVGVGEVDDLEPFYPERMASRILGMGDVQTC